jgi:hypothetical protein
MQRPDRQRNGRDDAFDATGSGDEGSRRQRLESSPIEPA